MLDKEFCYIYMMTIPNCAVLGRDRTEQKLPGHDTILTLSLVADIFIITDTKKVSVRRLSS